MDLFLSAVNYEEFWSEIKKTGYTMRLRAENIRDMSPMLGIDYETEMQRQEFTDARLMLQDKNFAYNNGVYAPTKLLILGFMYCKF